MDFSIIIVTYNRKNEFESCIKSIASQATNFNFEVIVIYNGETSYSEKKIPEQKNYFIKKSTPSVARNVAISKASGKYLFFLDDDCILPENYFSKIDFSSDWEILGGPDRTPPQASPFQKLIGHALSSPLCMGPTFRRHSSNSKYLNTNANEFELILCNLWIKRSIFSQDGHAFDKTLFRNEENYLLKELKLENKRIFYNPELFVFHQRKKTLETLANSIMKSGECRVQNFTKLPQQRELIYSIPLLFTLLFFLWIFNPLSFLTFLFLAYILVTYLYGAIQLRTFSPRFTLLHFLIIFFYSFGLLKGIMSASTKRSKETLASD